MSLSQRIDLSREAAFTLGPLQVRPAEREVLLGARRDVLEPRVMQVLTLLARHRDTVVTRDALITACWESRAVGDDAINRCISRIRRLAESYGGFSLETITRVGYRLTVTAEPQAQSVRPNEPPPDEPPPDEPPPPQHRVWRRRLWGLLAAGIVLLALAWLLWPPRQVVVRPPVRQLIAVLAFTPLSTEPQIKLFGQAVVPAIAGTLAKVGEPVVSPTESLAFQGSAKAQAAAALKAMYLVDGDVLKDGDRLRVTVRLDDAVRGETIFSHTFEERSARAAALIDRVAAYVAAVSWGTDITRWDPRTAPEILRAFEQQERGDLYAAYETARALAQRQPHDGDVQRVYAWDVLNLIYASPAKRKLWLVREARQAAERSLALVPSQGETRAVMAAATPHFLWAEREAHLRAALAISPDSVGVPEFLSWLLSDVGRFRDSEPFARSAYERFPYHVPAFRRRVEQLLGSGDATAARPVLERALRLWPDNGLLLDLAFEANAFSGHPENAASFLTNDVVVEHLPPQTQLLWSAIVRALVSRNRADIAVVTRRCAQPGDNWSACLLALSALGKVDQAFAITAQVYPDQRAANPEALMQKWLANPELPSTRYLFVPVTAPLRADPRFGAILERVGLAQYWRAARHLPDICDNERLAVCR